MNWFFSMVAHNPTSGLWIITIASIIIGIFIGYLIHYLIFRLTWRKWLPVRHQHRMLRLESNLLTTKRERDWYQNKYISSRTVIKGAISILTTANLNEELKDESVNDSNESSNRKSTARGSEKTGQKSKPLRPE